MQVQLGSSSSQLRYAPCRGCDPGTGFASYLDFYARDANGTDAGMVTTGSGSVGLNFTGTGVAFALGFVGPGGAAENGWATNLLVNGSAPPPGANTTGTSVAGLPLGRHEVTLAFSQAHANSSNPVTVHHVTGTLGQVAGAAAANATIDDSWWRNGSLWISGGWNMVEGGQAGQSNYINATEYEVELGTVGNDYNASVSWTTEPRAWNAVRWNGSAVWVYGITGGDAGTFQVALDNVTQGVFDASGGPRVYDSVLFHTAGLAEGPHEVVLTNVAGRLSFDRLVAASGLEPVAAAPAAPSSSATALLTASDGPPPPPAPATSAASSAPADPYAGWTDTEPARISSGAIAGIVIGVLLLLGAALALLLYRRRRDRSSRQGWDEDRPWHKRLFAEDKGWRFVHLDGGAPVQAAPPRDKDALHISSSSFGSAAGHLASLPPSPRRSIAGFFRAKSVRRPAEAPLPPLPRGASASPGSDGSADVDEEYSGARDGSPNPLFAALGGQHSPLTQLQRSFSRSSGGRAPPPPAIKVARSATPDESDFGVLDLREHAPATRPSYTKARDSAYNASIRESAYSNHRNRLTTHTATSGPVGVREWYDWFGLSTYGDRASRQTARRAPDEKEDRESWVVVDGAQAPVSYVPPVEAQRSPRRRYFDKPSFLHRFG